MCSCINEKHENAKTNYSYLFHYIPWLRKGTCYIFPQTNPRTNHARSCLQRIPCNIHAKNKRLIERLHFLVRCLHAMRIFLSMDF